MIEKEATALTSSSQTESNKVESSVPNEIIGALVNIATVEKYKEMVAKHVAAPFNVSTPKEKVRKRPDGFDYVEGTWMDHVAKEHMPLYKYELLHVSWNLGWINILVSLTDRTTGNIEIGAGAARIQVSRGIDSPGFKDVIDMGNNLKAALTQAIKNAQSRFGVAADIYGKREALPTDDERKRFQDMLTQLNSISTTKATIFKEQWEGLGTDFSEFLDKWQPLVDKLSKVTEKPKKEKLNL